jgi:hypothetical protein
MSYGYSAPYHNSHFEFAQPHTDPYFVSPDSPAAQLGLNQEEIREILEEQERWDREFQEELEEEERARSAQHHEQEQHQDEARWVPTPSISDSEPTPQAYEMPDEPPENATSPYDNGPFDRADSPAALYQPPTPIPDARSPPPSFENDLHGTPDDDDDVHVASFERNGFEDAALAGPDQDMIEPLVCDLAVPGVSEIDWAAEMDSGMALGPQGEYLQTTYPPPPSPAPWYPPHPPTSDYAPPRTHYAPPRTWYYPMHVQRTSRRPHSRPHSHPPPARRPRLENRTCHVTATRHDRFRATTHAAHTGQPRYVPPALRNNIKTSYRSQYTQSNRSNNWRDSPPHKDPSARNLKRSDSPNWRAPSPNRPTTFRNPSPLPQSPPTPLISPPCPTPLMPPKNHAESRLTLELVSLIKTTSEALQKVVCIAERLIRQVNAERRLAHKPWRTPWSLHEDVHGNAVCPQSPAFPSGRGVPVAGPPSGSEVLA